VHATAHGEPIVNHVCHCNVWKNVTGQKTTHMAFNKHGDLEVDHPEKLNRQPFNAENANDPLELCTCADCGAPIMLDDKEGRIRVAVPNVMGYDDTAFPGATYHAFYDDSKGYPKPNDGRSVYDSLCPDFVWPQAS
jgi:hypothetical protein